MEVAPVAMARAPSADGILMFRFQAANPEWTDPQCIVAALVWWMGASVADQEIIARQGVEHLVQCW